ncbi:MAG: type II secretion system protein [Planctomycetes bacterium]|nr:type II secretion system protein [Planctomycetota bacterium]
MRQHLINKTNRKGFTLTELLIVVAIISFMTVLSVSAYELVFQKSEVVTCTNRLRQVGKALLNYADDYYNHLPAAVPPQGFGSLHNWGDLWASQDSTGMYFSTQRDPADSDLLLGNKSAEPRLPRLLEHYTDSVTLLHCPGRGISQYWPMLGPFYYNATSPWGSTFSAELKPLYNCRIWEPRVRLWQTGAMTAIAACQNPEGVAKYAWEWRHGDLTSPEGSLNNHLFLDGSIKTLSNPKTWTLNK